jgi:hypothetical protein
MKHSPHFTSRERKVQAARERKVQGLFAWVAGFAGEAKQSKWRVGNFTKPADEFAKNIWNEFMDSILDGNPDPLDAEVEAAERRADKQSQLTHSILHGHVEAWVKANKNAKVLLTKDSERSARIDELLNDSRPRNVMTEFLADELLQSILFDKRKLTPEKKAAELLYLVLKLNPAEVENIGECRECGCAFWKPRSDSLDCSQRCHNRYHRHTEKGRKQRARDKRRSRAAKREMKTGEKEREGRQQIEKLLAAEEKTRRRN